MTTTSNMEGNNCGRGSIPLDLSLKRRTSDSGLNFSRWCHARGKEDGSIHFLISGPSAAAKTVQQKKRTAAKHQALQLMKKPAAYVRKTMQLIVGLQMIVAT